MLKENKAGAATTTGTVGRCIICRNPVVDNTAHCAKHRRVALRYEQWKRSEHFPRWLLLESWRLTYWRGRFTICFPLRGRKGLKGAGNTLEEAAKTALTQKQVRQKKSVRRHLFEFRLISALAGGGPHLALKAVPTLLTDCVIVGHAKKADVIFTPRQWFALCVHMLNENPQNFFLMPYLKDGKAKFAKAYNAKANERVSWAWDTITGKAKSSASIGFYPTNKSRRTRWGAMDFDIHDDDPMRAREFAHKAFALLIREPQLYVALTTSAGDPQHSGWHLFIFTEQFYPCEEWTRLLKQVANQIGAPIQSGICEIFPDDCRGIGHAIRAPGTWNPKSDECGLILKETVTKLLPAELPASSPKEVMCSLDARSTPREGKDQLTYREFSITAPQSRRDKLTKLIGHLFFQVGREIAWKQAEFQYNEANPAPVASLDEHLVDFEKAWAGMERQWRRKLSPVEREKFDALTTENERDAFRILRNWSQTDKPDFFAHCQTLGDRLGITLQGAANIRVRFCSLGILKQTAPYVRHKLAARYAWMANGNGDSLI